MSLRFAANLGFADMDCSSCGEIRLHYRCKCVSCGTLHPTGAYKPRSWGEFQVSKKGRRARAKTAEAQIE